MSLPPYLLVAYVVSSFEIVFIYYRNAKQYLLKYQILDMLGYPGFIMNANNWKLFLPKWRCRHRVFLNEVLPLSTSLHIRSKADLPKCHLGEFYGVENNCRILCWRSIGFAVGFKYLPNSAPSLLILYTAHGWSASYNQWIQRLDEYILENSTYLLTPRSTTVPTRLC